MINRQEELCDVEALLAREANVNIEQLSRPALRLNCPLRGDALTRMRQGLSYLGVRRGPDSHLVDGQARVSASLCGDGPGVRKALGLRLTMTAGAVPGILGLADDAPGD